MTWPVASRKPLATSALLGLLVAALTVLAPTASASIGGRLANGSVAVHAATPISSAQAFVSTAAASSRPADSVPADLPRALAEFALVLVLIRDDLPARWRSAWLRPPRRNRAPPRRPLTRRSPLRR